MGSEIVLLCAVVWRARRLRAFSPFILSPGSFMVAELGYRQVRDVLFGFERSLVRCQLGVDRSSYFVRSY